MPEHQMPFADHIDYQQFKRLDDFTQGYIHAIYWTECNYDNEELEHMTFADLASSALTDIIAECKEFQEANAQALEAYCRSYSLEQAGTDYWLTRNRHGAGFWDRDLSEVGAMLTEAAHADGGRYAYASDNGKLYVE